ncbi:hypothetical protein D3C86_1973580 [compost metagenome]
MSVVASVAGWPCTSTLTLLIASRDWNVTFTVLPATMRFFRLCAEEMETEAILLTVS